MITYRQLKNKHQEEFNEFPMKFAFSNAQFKRAMEELGLTENDIDKIHTFGYSGGFYLRTDSERLQKMLDRQEKEKEELMKDEKFVCGMFGYELSNHEFGYTRELEDTLDYLDYTIDEINKNPLLNKALKKVLKNKYNITNYKYYGLE